MKTLIIGLGSLVMVILFGIGISYLFKPTVYNITATSIVTGETIMFTTVHSYKPGDTTFKEKYYSIVKEIK